MANTEQAAEPTMEEILSSIRRIISDENGEEAEAEVIAPVVEAAPEEVAESLPEPEPEAELEVVPEPEPEEAAQEPEESPEEDQPEDSKPEDTQPEDPQPEEAEDDVLELTDVVEEPASDDLPELAETDDLELVVPEPAPEPEPEPEPVAAAPAMPAGDDALKTTPIVGDNTHDSAMAAFNLLAGSLLTKDGTARTLDDLVQLMLRPMLKTWLDDNLPGMVERLVQDEIERISRGHR